ncbi:MAG: AsmA family protein [Fluviicola sp.]|nr:AsmA family protein [Fluviicola sp.]
MSYILNWLRSRTKRFWKRFIFWILTTPVLLFATVVTIVYVKQDEIVQEVLTHFNEDFEGEIKIKESHISPFASFPYISIDLENVQVFEDKVSKKQAVVDIDDCYVGFNLFDLLKGNYTIKSIRLADGFFRIVQHKDGNLNILNALKSKKPSKEVKEDFQIDLKKVKIDRIDISKYNESNKVKVDAYIQKTVTSIKSSDKHFYIDLNSQFVLSVLKNGDSTFVRNKHISLSTVLDMNERTKKFSIEPTEVALENSSFNLKGEVGLTKEVPLDLKFTGEKENFDLIIAIAPNEIGEVFKQFENQGRIYFKAHVKGKSANGNKPVITANFGCKNGFFQNVKTNKKLESIGFHGTFSNGAKRDLETMKLEIQQFTARPEAGKFNGNLSVVNFKAPDIDLKLNSDFDLDFIAKFVNAKELRGLKGKVQLTMNFHDIIDLTRPERAIEQLNQSYFTKLTIDKLSFDAPNLPVPIRELNMKAEMKGHQAKIKSFNLEMGHSDVSISGAVSDLPAIVHHTDLPVVCDLAIFSDRLDLAELSKTETETGIDERIDGLKLKLQLKSSAKKISEMTYLPEGEFLIRDFYAKFKHYPHTLHDFHADVFIDKENFNVIDFSGLLDSSDFHFNGNLRNYPIWFEEKLHGETFVDFDLNSKKLKLKDLFSYGGQNFVPEDYRQEELDQLRFHAATVMHFDQGDFKSVDLNISNLSGKMKMHPLKIDAFKGGIHLTKNDLDIKNFAGKIGHSDLRLGLHWYFNPKEGQHHRFSLNSNRLDVDELTNFTVPSAASTHSKQVDHDKGFTLYDLPFPDLDGSLKVGNLNYHTHKLNQFETKFTTTKSHEIQLSQLDFSTAEGSIKMEGVLSGKDKKHIFFTPKIRVSHVQLDKLLLKFDNFGQDQLISNNLHGYFNGVITGKIHLHADLVPIIDDSKIVIQMEVLNGALNDFAPLKALETYFEDKNVSHVRFDTLKNTFTIDKGVMEIPKMSIESTLGYLEISGKQGLSGAMDMEYEIGIPWKMIGNVAANKLFKRNKQEQEEIQFKEEDAKLVFVQVKGNLDDFDVQLIKKKKRKK